ncbi:hypothetical protein KKC16_00320 [Patescibacteria group bacterium]|nr:hypothetical protein [Patescibacteria group bacterium]
MGNANFSKKECIRALLKIGFFKEPHQARRSPHDKYLVSLEYKQEIQRSFIMIPHGRKLKCQRAILKELKKIGGGELVAKFLEKL